MTVAGVDSGGANTILNHPHGDRDTVIVGWATARGTQIRPEHSGFVGQQLLSSFLKENIS